MERALQQMYGTKAPFLTSPPNLVTAEYRGTVGEVYTAPRKAVAFANPGVLTVGEFPTWESMIPNQEMWQDEAYNTAKRQLARSAQEYLQTDPRTLFKLPDPVVVTLLENEDREAKNLVKEMELMEAREKREKRMNLLLSKGYSEAKAEEMVDRLEEEEDFQDLRNYEGIPPQAQEVEYQPEAVLRTPVRSKALSLHDLDISDADSVGNARTMPVGLPARGGAGGHAMSLTGSVGGFDSALGATQPLGGGGLSGFQSRHKLKRTAGPLLPPNPDIRPTVPATLANQVLAPRAYTQPFDPTNTTAVFGGAGGLVRTPEPPGRIPPKKSRQQILDEYKQYWRGLAENAKKS